MAEDEQRSAELALFPLAIKQVVDQAAGLDNAEVQQAGHKPQRPGLQGADLAQCRPALRHPLHRDRLVG